MTIAQDLKTLNKNIQALGKTLDRLLKAVEKDEKLKAKPTKRIPARKAPARKAPAKKAPAKKKTAQPTATDKILKIIKASKKGVDAPTLIKKTGFDQKKVRNILFRTYKQGKIKRLDKGIYTGA
jgi:predicted Rossmann fold nucleotide-binding protein DprA/Smf involved in DNA uptake